MLRHVLTVTGALLVATTGRATTHTWTGAAGSGSNLIGWSHAANWDTGAPASGENALAIVFPDPIPPGPRSFSQLDIDDLSVATISIGRRGYAIAGTKPFTLTGGLTTVASGGTTFSQIAATAAPSTMTVRLGAAQTFSLNHAFRLNTALDLAGFTLTVDTTSAAHEIQGTIGGTGGLIVQGDAGGELAMTAGTLGSAANNFTGGATVASGTLRLARADSTTCLPGPVTIAGGTLRLGQNQQIASGAALTVASGTFDLAGFTQAVTRLSSSGACTIDLGSGGGNTLTVGANGVSDTLGCTITGAGNLSKNGSGTLTLTADNPLTGAARVAGNGTVIVRGAQPASAVQVLQNGTFGGDGTVGGVSVANLGTLRPGVVGVATLHAGGLIMASGSTLQLHLGTDAATSDDLVVTGAVTLDGALSLDASGAPALPLVLIANDGSDAVTGAFTGVPEGAILSLGGGSVAITYFGGDGNDVALISPSAVTTTTTTIPATTSTTLPGACAPAPRTDCRAATLPARVNLLIKRGPSAMKSVLTWNWLKGDATVAADFGAPTSTTDEQICLYDGAGTLVGATLAPAGGTCGKRPCWKALGSTGFQYKSTTRTPAGIASLTLKAGASGKARLQLKASGANLPVPTLPLQGPVTVQLQPTSGACFTSRFPSPAKNTARLFRAHGG